MPFQINYNSGELRLAAEFIWEKNPYAKRWASSVLGVENHIKDFMVDIAKRNIKVLEQSIALETVPWDWTEWSGTGGYYVTFYENTEMDDQGIRTGMLSIQADIFVDPAVGTDRMPDSYQSLVVDNQ